MSEREVDARLLSSLSRGHKDTDEKTEAGEKEVRRNKNLSKPTATFISFLQQFKRKKAFKKNFLSVKLW